MASKTKTKASIVKDAVRRFYHIQTRTLARYIADSADGPMWERDIEKIRGSIRHYRGKRGEHSRGHAEDLSLFTDTIPMPQTWRKKTVDYYLAPGRWLLIGDLHIPFHEPVPIKSAFEYGRASGIDGIFINGDFQDCAGLSFWRTAKREFNREIEIVIDFLDYIRGQFPHCKIVYKPGNHEYRLPSYYMTHAPELATSPLAAMETLLGFEDRGIEFLDYFQRVIAGKLTILHGHEIPYISKAVNAAKGLFNRTHNSALCHHCHSKSEHSDTDIKDKDLATWSVGCLCDLHPDWNPFGNRWNWGFAGLELSKDKTYEVDNKRVFKDGKIR